MLSATVLVGKNSYKKLIIKHTFHRKDHAVPFYIDLLSSARFFFDYFYFPEEKDTYKSMIGS